MEYFEAPRYWDRLPGQFGVFLAGGITGCPDWQSGMTKALRETNYAVLNPRRKDFPINDPSAAYEQIEWEHVHLKRADVVSFWFCKESIQPIALFELGAWSMNGKPILVGVEPGYPREIDVRIQLRLATDVYVVDNLPELIDDVIKFEQKLRNPNG